MFLQAVGATSSEDLISGMIAVVSRVALGMVAVEERK
jgi:hypothetical protein